MVAQSFAAAAAAGVTLGIRTGRELAVALLDESIVEARLDVPRVDMAESDFTGLDVPHTMRRNLTIRGSPSLPDWPVLTMTAVRKIVLGPYVSVRFLNVIMYRYRRDNPLRLPGADIIIPGPAGSPPATVVVQDSVNALDLCFSKAIAEANYAAAPRPAALPGNQSFVVFPPQDGCSNDSVFLRKRCYPGTIPQYDLGLYCLESDASGRPTYANYNLLLLNTTVFCLSILPDPCIEQYGAIGCYLVTLNRLNNEQLLNRYLPAPPAPPSLAPPTPVLQPPALGPSLESSAGGGGGGGGGSGGGGDGWVVPVAVCVGVGGSALLAAAVALIVWRLRARRQAARGGGAGLACVKIELSADGSGDGDEVDPALKPTASASCTGPTPSTAAAPTTGRDGSSQRQLGGPRSGEGDVLAVAHLVTNTTPFHQGFTTHVCLFGDTETRMVDGTSPGSGSEDAPADARTGSGDASSALMTAGPGPGQDQNRPPVAPRGASASDCHGPHNCCGAPAGPGSGPGPDSGPDPGPGPAVVELLPTVLGKGAFGRVQEGLYGGRHVAVKLMLSRCDVAAGDTQALAASLAQELEVLARCQHKNVVQLLAANLSPPRPFCVLERMEISLDKLLYGSGTTGDRPAVLPMHLVLHIAREIACGLEFLHPTITQHRTGVTGRSALCLERAKIASLGLTVSVRRRRDLKPANVLLNDPFGCPVVKISDFGLSRLRETTLCTLEPEAGTAAYLAPECFDLNLDGCITYQADMWSFGTLLWECLAGVRPWEGLGPLNIAVQVAIHGRRLPLAPRDAPGRCPSRWPPRLVRLISDCWERDPQRRPAASEVVKRLALVEEMGEGLYVAGRYANDQSARLKPS
ncbi:hypothetical protein HYH03_011112 [Edaphochlamys debaryana]|uniref:Protein kinase domain-containing protein n=1 Tax=Edaphochlamys debaryana TaxID=47281 RepID=A0A836BWT3_9CHLO|nr:hypothetical protein HYH03_011112 [Edaphochlamys debaryana]|eukprot:KAG2490483.1 hypothetical protein HYH03_011112 [Edaphochlamys debaryana]